MSFPTPFPHALFGTIDPASARLLHEGFAVLSAADRERLVEDVSRAQLALLGART
jgi:hypothetical protein